MKKTLNINIGNSIIHIEEDAYEMLTIYLNEVKQHFAKTADDFEIVTDIENRIAEMFTEMLAEQQKQAIGIFDVQSVIRQMGSVKDFEQVDEEETAEKPAEFPAFNLVKKLYRDTDQAMIAGVCAGLSHYLDIDARWVRLGVLLSIFLAGSGALAYLILWIMIPRAETMTEKMNMRGEETNLRGFANRQMEPFLQESKGFLAELVDLIGNFLNGTGRIIFKTLAIGIIAMAACGLISLFVALVVLLGIWDADAANYFPFNIINAEYFNSLALSAFVAAAVPLLALALFSARVAFSRRDINKTLSFVLLIIWLGGVAPLIFYITRISSEFKDGAEFSQQRELKPAQSYTLTVYRTRFFTREDSLKYRIDAESYRGRTILTDLDDEFKAPRSIRLWIEKSENGKVSLMQNFRSRGRNFEAALKNAQNIHYDFLQTDSLINFNPMVQLAKGTRWRGQEVELTMKVPVGSRLNISRALNRYLNGPNYWDCHYDEEQDFTEWVMTAEGIKCQHEIVKEPSEE